MTERPDWALDGGLPSLHTIRAAMYAGRLIDTPGAAPASVELAYVLYPSDGLYPPRDMRLGLSLLLHCGLVVQTGDRLERTAALSELLAVPESDALGSILSLVVIASGADAPDDVMLGAEALAAALGMDPDRREALLMALAQRHDDATLTALGAAGEELVVVRAAEQLAAVGLSELIPGVSRVSLVSDALGYDVVAPRLGGTRRFEVKTTSRYETGVFTFHLSRSEYEWGVHDSDWALVACRMLDRICGLVGWCRAEAITPYLPNDAPAGHWASARVVLPESNLIAGLPSPL